MEMHQIRYFLSVAETLNFTKAAESCNVAQPALSRAVKALEEELGGLLFHRENRNTHLTELGRMVHPHLAELYENSKSVKLMARDYSKLARTPLKLGVMSTIAPDQFIDLIGDLRAHHPGVELHLCDSNAPDLRNRLLAGDLELAVYALPGEAVTEKTHHQQLFREQMVIVVGRNHSLANQNAVRVADLNNENYIHRNNCEFAGYADEILAKQGVTVKPAYRSDRDDWTLAMVAAGLGFGFMPFNSARHSGVVALPVIEPEFWREVNLVSVRGRPHTAAVGALVHAAMKKKWFGEQATATHFAAE
jgi:LysR family hydrogen peroxide-inducible transcriptional activator